MLNDDERLEYQELGEFARHDDTVHLNVSYVMLPVLFSALVLAWHEPQLVYPLATGSFVVWLYWWVVRGRRTSWAAQRYERLRALENKGHMWHHLKIHNTDLQAGFFQRVWRIKKLEALASIVLLVFWIGIVATPVWPIAAVVSGNFVLAYLLGELKKSEISLVRRTERA